MFIDTPVYELHLNFLSTRKLLIPRDNTIELIIILKS